MFDHADSVVGLWPGERPEDAGDDLAFEVTYRELADGWVGTDQHVLPPDLEEIPVGLFLAAVVGVVDPARLEGHDLVRLLKARARLASHHEAGKYQAMAEIAFAPPYRRSSGVVRSSEQVDYAAVEVAAALALTRRSSEDQLSRAVVLSDRLVRVRQAFSAGLLDTARVRVFEQTLGHLSDEAVDEILDRVLDDAGDLTTGQLRARLARLVLEADPDGSKSSYEAGLADRRVVSSSNPDHTATLGVFSAAPDDVAAARAHIEALARSMKTRHEPRTLDQLRTDVAVDLLQGKCVHADQSNGGGRANVTVSAETLAGLSDAPGHLEGYGPVFAEIARKTVRANIDGEWVFTVTDQGRPVATGTLTRRPTTSQKRQVGAVYATCVMVGCRQPVHDCDLDHRHPHAQGGITCTTNLAPLCRHHHMTRHHARWTYKRLSNGDHQWTAPSAIPTPRNADRRTDVELVRNRDHSTIDHSGDQEAEQQCR